MRYCWSVLIIVLLTGCGQPLKINSPSAPSAAQTANQPALRPTLRSTPDAADRSANTPLPTSLLTTAQSVPAQPPTSVTESQTTPSVVVIPQTAVPLDNQQRWRAEELERQVIDPQRIYIAKDSVELLWYDPATGQSLEIGSIRGEFPAQATFVLRTNGRRALEVPYRINADFGLTAISEAIRARMQAAGYAESVEAYIETTEVVVPK